ncbi:MAG: tetratricopeptide repeat protein [Planctomycetes bacterium]|nr:tetratricopeptide repeat protein [Planctomycetota bacterium]
MSAVRFIVSLGLCVLMTVLACLHGYASYCLAQSGFRAYTGMQVAQKHTLLNRARMCEPDNARVYYELGKLYDHIREQETRSAKVINMPYLAEDIPGMPTKPAAVRGECLKRALSAYRKAVDRDPKNALYHYRLGKTLLDVPVDVDESAGEKALEELQAAVGLDPNEGLYHYWMGIYYQTHGSLAGAIGKYREAIRCDRTLARDVFRTAWDINHYPPALQALAEGDEDLESFLPEFLLQFGSPGGARAACIAACQKAGGFSLDHQVRLLVCLIHLKEAALVRLFALAWLEREPVVPLELMLVSGLELGGKRDLAIQKMEEVAKRDPSSPLCHARLGDLYRNARRIQDAVREYEEAIKLEPKQAGYYEALANLYWSQRDFSAAVVVYRRLADVFPDNPQVHYKVGNACMATQDFDGAIAAFRRATELAPDHPRLKRALARAAGLRARQRSQKGRSPQPGKPSTP